ncbi:hypothetical protein ABZR88_02510 [Mucilaginibacter yixingensis]
MPDLGLNKVRVVENGSTILLETNPVNSGPEIDPHLTYYWYSSNHVHTTQGGYSGRLLNGAYSEFYENKELKEQGKFKKGLKSGEWKKWNEQGKLLAIVTWHEGIQSGDFSVFDEDGKLKQSGVYRNGLLEGKIKTYNKDGVTIQKYHLGKPVPPSLKRPFLQRIHFWGHKRTAAAKSQKH